MAQIRSKGLQTRGSGFRLEVAENDSCAQAIKGGGGKGNSEEIGKQGTFLEREELPREKSSDVEPSRD
jgi:hypothetical protein